jgi:hypothetical protein
MRSMARQHMAYHATARPEASRYRARDACRRAVDGLHARWTVQVGGLTGGGKNLCISAKNFRGRLYRSELQGGDHLGYYF